MKKYKYECPACGRTPILEKNKIISEQVDFYGDLVTVFMCGCSHVISAHDLDFKEVEENK